MFLEILVQLLPLLIPLLKKDATSRPAAVEMGKAVQRAAMKGDDWKGILAGGFVQRIAAMSDDEIAAAVASIESANATYQAHMAKAPAGGGE